jgi:hypothetical protein
MLRMDRAGPLLSPCCRAVVLGEHGKGGRSATSSGLRSANRALADESAEPRLLGGRMWYIPAMRSQWAIVCT